MKERPILFSGPMVRALLEGRKTQTRRIVKHKDVYLDVKGLGATNDELRQRANEPAIIQDANFGTDCPAELCPFGKPGDRLWVRESWAKVPQTAYWHDQTIPHQVSDEDGYKWWAIYREGWERSSPGWKPSIHMPRWASRILLEVVSVRVERLNDISHKDVIAEGIEPNQPGYYTCHNGAKYTDFQEYQQLWESINGQGSWADNPYVWVIEFKVIQP